VDIRRVDTSLSDSQVGALQVEELDVRNPKPKVVVADSLYGNNIFLAVFLVVKHAFALVRLRSTLVFYERPKPHPKGTKGAPAKHGAKFKLSQPSRAPDRTETFLLGEQTVILRAWQGLHLKKLSGLVGMVLRIEFLRADGTPRYQRPMWLFWTGPETASLQELCRIYLWRFAIEIVFPQMTKTDVFTFGTGRDYITDLNIFVCDDHPIDQQFYQFPLLLKSGLFQTRLHPLTKRFDRSIPTCQLLLLSHLVHQLFFLLH
jgi:hypothetical protein